MPKNQDLEGAIETLSEVQKEAVNWTSGPLLVLAGPGSGKTRVLTTRIARLLHESPVRPFRVLALTFTVRAADEMRERIESLAPEAEDRLFVGTFHAFCSELLRQQGQHLGLRTDFSIYSTREDRTEIAGRAIASEEGRAAGLVDEDVSLLPLVDRAKAKLIESDGVAGLFKGREKGDRFEAFYKAYDAELSAANALDFNSLIQYAVRVLTRFPALAARYRSAYPYWFVDEFQDTNAAQYGLLRAMAGDDSREIFAVADDDQIIYQWNGADYRRLDQFRADFDAALLQIPTNFRCPAEVVACANDLIACNLHRSPDKKPVVADRDEAESTVIEVLSFPTPDDEAREVARLIAENRQGAFNETVVLARVRRLLDPIARELADLGVKSQVIVRRDEFQGPAFHWLHNTLRLAVHRADTRIFEALVGTFNEMFGLAFSAEELVASSEADRVDLLSSWHRVVAEEVEEADGRSLAEAARGLHHGSLDHFGFATQAIDVFDRWLAEEEETSESAAFLGLLEDRRAWRSLSTEVQRAIGAGAELDRFLQELDLRSKEPPLEPDTVPLMTIHGAKGNEFDHVYLVGLAEDVLPSFQSKKKGDESPEFEEERRNCFVAVTRCKETLTMSFAAKYFGWGKEPSRFIEEMGLGHLLVGSVDDHPDTHGSA